MELPERIVRGARHHVLDLDPGRVTGRLPAVHARRLPLLFAHMFDRIDGVRRWEQQWSITIHWDRAEHSPWHTTTYQTHAANPAELRRLVEAARRDPHVIAFPYHSIRVMVGDEPTHCPAGHEYQHSRVAGRLQQTWTPCRCGGHHILICREPGCPYPHMADPPADNDCDPTVPR